MIFLRGVSNSSDICRKDLWTLETSAKSKLIAGHYQGEKRKPKSPEHDQGVALGKEKNNRISRKSLKMLVVSLSERTPGED